MTLVHCHISSASTGRSRELVRAMLDVAETQIRNPWIGRELAGLFADAGLTDVTVQAEVLPVRDFEPDVINDLPLLAEDLRAQGHEGVEDLHAAAKDDTFAGRTVATLTLFTVVGTPVASAARNYGKRSASQCASLRLDTDQQRHLRPADSIRHHRPDEPSTIHRCESGGLWLRRSPSRARWWSFSAPG